MPRESARHHRRVIALLKITRQLLTDVLWFDIVALRPTSVVAAENLFLRRQRDLRTRNRHDQARVSGLGDSDVRSAPA